MKTDSPLAILKTLEKIMGAIHLSVAPALTVDRFQTVVQKSAQVGTQLSFTTTNGDLCVNLFRGVLLCARLENGAQYFRSYLLYKWKYYYHTAASHINVYIYTVQVAKYHSNVM